MREILKKKVMALTAAAMVFTGFAPAAQAVDAPKWVAAMHVEAQQMVGLRWMPAAGATGYKVLRSDTAGSGHVEIAAPSTPQHFDKDIEPGSTYYYVLQAVAGAEVSANSAEKMVKISGKKKVEVLPPTWKETTVQQKTEFGKTTVKVGLFWNPDPGVIAYNIYRSETAGKDYQMVGSVSEPQYIDTKVEKDKTYFYVLSGLDSGFQETKMSAEKQVETKVVAKAKKKARAKKLKLAMRPVKELGRIGPGEHNAVASPVDSVVNSDGDLYVLNASTSSVSIFESDGTFKSKFGKRGGKDDEIGMGMGLGIDSDDNIFVADGRKVLKFASDGRHLKTFKVPMPEGEDESVKRAQEARKNSNLVPQPFDVAEAANGDLLVVDNAYGRILVLDPSDGELLSAFGTYGPGEGQFKNPGSIAVNSKGEIFINDNLNRRAAIYTPDYKLKAVAGISKNMVGAFLGMQGAAVDENDNFIVSDPPMATIQVFSSEDGRYLYHYSGEDMTPDKGSKGQRPALNIGNPAGPSYNKEEGVLYVPLTQMQLVWRVEVLDEVQQDAK